MSVDGTWKITVQTPMGAQELDDRARERRQRPDRHPERQRRRGPDLRRQLRRRQRRPGRSTSRSPMSLTVDFKAKVNGDTISGTAEAGMFPPSPFSGARA